MTWNRSDGPSWIAGLLDVEGTPGLFGPVWDTETGRILDVLIALHTPGVITHLSVRHQDELFNWYSTSNFVARIRPATPSSTPEPSTAALLGLGLAALGLRRTSGATI